MRGCKGRSSRRIQAFQTPISNTGIADMIYFLFEIFLTNIYVVN